MKFFFLTLCVFVFCAVGFSQDKMDYPQDTYPDSLSDTEKEILRKRNWAENFSQSLNKIGDPSIASFVFSDFNHNTNSSKQKKNFLLNTTIQPILGIGGKRWYIKNYVHSFQVVPTISIRIFQNDTAFKDHSMPVRTPDFKVKFNYLFSHARLWNDSLRCKIYFGTTFSHHSNGQDGYEFINDVTKHDSVVNTYSGNFSEIAIVEFMTGGLKVFHRKLKKEEKKPKDGFLRQLQFNSKTGMAYWKIGYEYHPARFTSEKFARYDLYGKNKLNIQVGYLFHPLSRHVVHSKQKQKWIPLEKNFQHREIRRLVINFSYILDRYYNISSDFVRSYEIAPFFDISKRMNIDFTWYERIGTTSDFAVFMRLGYYGSDPYNIYFQESIYVARVGIAFGNFIYGERK